MRRGGELVHVTPGLGPDDLGGGTADAWHGVQVGQIVVMPGGQLGDPCVQVGNEGTQVVDLGQQVSAHPGVVVGEGAIESLDELAGLAFGLPDRQ